MFGTLSTLVTYCSEPPINKGIAGNFDIIQKWLPYRYF